MGYATTDAAYSRKRADEASAGYKPRVCKERMYKKACKYCKEVLKLRNSDDEADNTLASECRARGTYYMVIVDLNDIEAGRQIYPCNISNWKALCELLPDKDDPDDVGVDFTNLKKPHAVIMKKKGKGRNTDYTIQIAPTGTKFPAKLMKKSPIDLDNILEILESDEVPTWTPKTGRNKFLIFPPWSKKAKGQFFKEIFYHWGIERLGLGSGGEDEEGEEEEYETEEETVGVDEEEEEYGDGEEEEEEEEGEEEEGEEEEDEDEEPEWSDMTAKELRKLAKTDKLKVKDIEDLKGKDLRKAVRKAWRKKHED
jgi:hypothetical protein